MGQRRAVALVGGMAVLLASVVFTTVFSTYGWGIYALLTTAAVVVAAIVARALRAPLWAQPLAMAAALLLLLTWLFPSGQEWLGFVPNTHTFGHFHRLLHDAGQSVQQLAAPVAGRPGLRFLTAAGIGVVAVVVDLLAVGLRRPALAGFPLLAVYSVPVAINSDSLPWIPFATGAAGYLWLLLTDRIDRVRRWGRRFAGNGRDIDTWEPSPLAGAGRRIGFAGLVLAVVLPLLVPGLSSGLLDRLAGYGNGVAAGDGPARLGASINPITTLRGSLRTDESIDLFQLRTDDPEPGYLRTAVADQITDTGFAPGPADDLRPVSLGLRSPTEDLSPRLRYDRYRGRITAQRLNDRYLPLPAGVVGLHPPRDGRWRVDDRTDVVSAKGPATAGQRWTFTYDSFRYTPRQLRDAPALSAADQVPARDVQVRPEPRIARRVASLTAGKSTEYDRVRAILDFFSPENGFRYSLHTKAGSSGSAIVDFLTNKRGYCEQYASAMTWMVRQAHIPARVVLGYTHGTKAGNGNVWQVTNHEAHAWVEVYFPSFGWVPFDPTPSVDVTGSATFGWAPNPSAPDSTGTDVDGADQPGRRADDDRMQPQHGGDAVGHAAAGGRAAPTYWPYWLAGVLLVVVVLLAVPATLRRVRRGRRRRRAPERLVDDAHAAGRQRRGAHAAWDELLDTLVDFRLDSAEPETPRTTAARVTRRGRLAGPDHAAVALLAQAEERARYSRRPMDVTDLPAASARVRAALAGRLSARQRLAASLLPRSVLRRWRTGIARTVSGGAATAATARRRLVRSLVPRRLLARR